MARFVFGCVYLHCPAAIRQYLCLSLLKNSASSIPAALQLSASIFLSLLQKFRSALKAEVGVFLPMIMLKVGGPQLMVHSTMLLVVGVHIARIWDAPGFKLVRAVWLLADPPRLSSVQLLALKAVHYVSACARTGAGASCGCWQCGGRRLCSSSGSQPGGQLLQLQVSRGRMLRW